MSAIATVAGVEQVFHFDAYGNTLGFDPALAATSILYAGEMFDARIQQQYLRARWYDAHTCRFNRLDPFLGNLRDPQCFHKYLYTHADPVNATDPTGLFSLGAHIAVAAAIPLGVGTVASVATLATGGTFAAGFFPGAAGGFMVGLSILGVAPGLAIPFTSQLAYLGALAHFRNVNAELAEHLLLLSNIFLAPPPPECEWTL